MRVLFVNYHHLDSNSGIHIFNLANHLVRLGVQCAVCVPDHKEAAKALGTPLFDVIDMADARADRSRQRFDLIHAWTPREVVRSMAEELAAIYECPIIVHLEDNEEALVAAATGIPFAALEKLPPEKLDAMIPPGLSHPTRYRQFLERAVGMTVIMDCLLDFRPADLPAEVIWAGYEESMRWHQPPDEKKRRELGIAADEHVVVYTGNVHAANRDEVFSLYLAVGLLNRRGIKTRLIRTGTDYTPLIEPTLSMLNDYCIPLGHVKRQDLPSILSLADVLVQPGKASPFNNYRFPSKLPEYLATGKPVMLPPANIGRFLKDGEECVLLQKGTALEIAQKLEHLFAHEDLAAAIGAGGRRFAESHLKWGQSAEELQAFYHRVLHAGQEASHLIPSTDRRAEAPDYSVVVFQMGKVGSRSVQQSLIRVYEQMGLPIQVHFSHILARFDESEQIIRKERPNPAPTLAVIDGGRILRSQIDQDPAHQWKIITLVRDPIARNIGTFFQVLEEHVPDWREHDPDDPNFLQRLQQAFLDVKTIHSEPERWFNEQLASVFNVDVYASPFPRATGYKVYATDSRTPVLLIRCEDLDRVAPMAIREFLGLSDFQLHNSNMGYEKDYARLYENFKKLPLPKDYVEAMYSTTYARHFYTDGERQGFALRWSGAPATASHERNVSTEPIIVFQMGKVGSRTIEQSLSQAYKVLGMDIEVHHAHFLNYLREMEASGIEQKISTLGLQYLQEMQRLRERIEESGSQKWNVISLVRDPVARNIASFFQGLSVNQFIPDWKERYRQGTLAVGEVQEAFLRLGTDYHSVPATWFDSQMKPVFDVDVYATPFATEKGYSIYPASARARLLVMRAEDINTCAAEAMHEYLGLEHFPVMNSNTSDEKDYAPLYRAFRALPLPAYYLEDLYGTRYAQHFYTRLELERFRRKWLGLP